MSNRKMHPSGETEITNANTVRRSFQTTDLVRMSLLVALVCVMAQLSVPNPMGVGMISLITIGLCLIGLLLTPKQAFITLVVYALLGAVGLPVFTGFTFGIDKFLGPTGGFILIWPVAYAAVSYLKGSTKSFLRYAVVTTLVSIIITYLAAVPYFMWVAKIPFDMGGLQKALPIIFYPFVIGDIVKAILSAWIATKIKL
ncbi:biotin transporter BioY [Veillonella sp. CHU740]|uniref:biotin transporter BioY n=1 Tax=Veillonella sp. CHU740 TaxID=2490950 RepID=UPI001F0C8017|nr:biotin transporter BioY [Veillonella sp. CHU740]